LKNIIYFNLLVKNKENETNLLLDEIKVKVMDFNIYDVFKKNNDDGGDNTNTNTDEFILLIKNLENKVFKKLELQDDRLKKNEETCNNNEKSVKLQFNQFGSDITDLKENLLQISQSIVIIDQLIIDNKKICDGKDGKVFNNEGEENNGKMNEDLIK